MDNGIGEDVCWNGQDLRALQCPCPSIEHLENNMRNCKVEIDAEIASINGTVSKLSHEVAGLRGDVHGLRGDVHNMAGSVKSMENSLSTIALTMSKLSDFPETWQSFKGFMRVMNWLRTNFMVLAVVVVCFVYLIYVSGKATGLIPV